MERDVSVVSVASVSKGRLRVLFDNGVGCLLYSADARAYGIREGAILPLEVYEEFLHKVLAMRATKRAMHLLERMDLTENKLRKKLAESEYPEECVNEAILYVKKYHYIDDVRYANNYIMFHQEKLSKRQLYIKLIQKGVPTEIAKSALWEYEGDEDALIQQLLEKRHYDATTATEKEKQRMYLYLARRGFASGVILSHLH